jgi:hypothetical protein
VNFARLKNLWCNSTPTNARRTARQVGARKCNMAIGLLNDDINLLKRAVEYLEG